MNNIAVLLAVHNGRKWIDEQLTTILNQKNVNLHVFISIDLSTDDSFSYLENKYGHQANITILPYGELFGSAGKNFYRLIKDVPVELYDYISFADQDDVWFENKLSHAIAVLKEHNSEVYSGNVMAFWNDGRKCLIKKAQIQVDFDYLFEAAGPGCTYVYSNKIASAFKKYLILNQNAQNVVLHDWLLYAFCRRNDYKWYIDRNVFMLYRQHDSNQVGANNSIKAWIKRLSLVKSSWYRNEVIKLAQLFGEKNEFINKCLISGYKGNLILAINSFKLRRRFRDRVILITLLLLNIF